MAYVDYEDLGIDHLMRSVVPGTLALQKQNDVWKATSYGDFRPSALLLATDQRDGLVSMSIGSEVMFEGIPEYLFTADQFGSISGLVKDQACWVKYPVMLSDEKKEVAVLCGDSVVSAVLIGVRLK